MQILCMQFHLIFMLYYFCIFIALYPHAHVESMNEFAGLLKSFLVYFRVLCLPFCFILFMYTDLNFLTVGLFVFSFIEASSFVFKKFNGCLIADQNARITYLYFQGCIH